MKRWPRCLWFLLVLVIVTQALPALAAESTYVVQPGDSLTTIAARYGVTVQELASVNGLSAYAWVYVGQRLTIPGSVIAPPSTAPLGNTYVVQAGDTLLSIAARHGVRVSALAAANNLRWSAWVYVGQPLVIPGDEPAPAPEAPATPTTPGVHIVQAGENLFRIGLRYGTTASALRAANGLNSNVIYVGQRLTIPGGTPSAAAPTPAPVPSSGSGTGGTKWIDVNLSTQTVTAYEGQVPVYSALASTGTWATPTVVGTYKVYVKYASTPMSGPGYYLPNVPHTMYFFRGYAIHGAYWHNNFGTPMSHGCVNLSLPDAEWFYNWAPVGTKVVTHY